MRSRSLIQLSLLFCLGSCLTGVATAQRVYWDPPGGSMGMGKTNPLRLVFEECAPKGDVPLPDVTGVTFGRPSTSTETSIINFKTTRRVTFTYPVQPRQEGSFTIPSFAVETDKGTQTVEAVGFEVGTASVGQTGLSINDFVESQIKIDQDTVWAGQVVDAEYVLSASRRYQTSISSDPEWKPSDLIVESFGQPERTEAIVHGERRAAVRYHTRIQPTVAGRLVLDPVRQDVKIQTGERSSFLFSQPRIEEFSVSSNQPVLVVKELPPGAPAEFDGAVGQFEIESKIVPEKVHVGEPITWTLSLSGVGNWTSGLHLPQREVSDDFEVVQPKSREKIEDGKMFTGSLTEDAVLVPTKAGDYTFGPVRFAYFDPAQGKYLEKVVEPRVFTIEPAANTRPSLPPSSTPEPSTTTPSDSDSGPTGNAAAVALPSNLPAVGALPREPIAEGRSGLAPTSYSPMWWIFAAFIPPVLTWLGLAWREVRRMDTVRERRRARRKMVELLSRVARRGVAPDSETLEAWRTLCIAIWRVPRAAPRAGDIAEAVTQLHGASTPEVWAELWGDTEVALFRPDRQVHQEWLVRALHAAREAKIRRTAPAFPHRWRHWSPATTTALALLLLLPAANRANADDPVSAYNDGRFEDARKAWMAQITENPKDWTARNNVALAYAQEDRWPDATAQWISAFLLHPRDDAIRANLRLAISRMDGVDPELRRLVDGGRIDRFATVLSPAEWQVAFFSGAVISAIGLMMMVMALYRRRQRRLRRIGLTTGILGMILSVLAMYAETRYGLLARPASGMVVTATQLRSIPTDLAEKQQSAPLPPGTVVVVQRSFLGWDQVVAGDEAIGWVRREMVTPFYRGKRPALDKLATGVPTKA